MDMLKMAEDERRNARQQYAWARKMEHADYLSPELRTQHAADSRERARKANARAKRYETRARECGAIQA